MRHARQSTPFGALPRCPEHLNILGIDLSGPKNTADTYATAASEQGQTLRFVASLRGADDSQIAEYVSSLAGSAPVVVGIDAPLSYNPGGGDRPSDAELRGLVREHGGGVGIMPPTMSRMVYLTLHGIALARMLENLDPTMDLRVVEVHPGAALLLRGAPIGDLRAVKRVLASRLHLLDWLEAQGLRDLPRPPDTPDHFVMACAAALAAWDWARRRPAWRFPARPPFHPYDFAC